MTLALPNFSNIDVEDVMDAVKSLISDNINAYVAQMNTKKPDIELSEINADAYMIQQQRQDLNFDPFVLIREESTESESVGPDIKQKVKIEIFVVLSNPDDTQDTSWRRVLRYRRILREIFQKGWTQLFNGRVQMKMESLPPTAVLLMNSQRTYTGAGVSLEVTYA